MEAKRPFMAKTTVLMNIKMTIISTYIFMFLDVYYAHNAENGSPNVDHLPKTQV